MNSKPLGIYVISLINLLLGLGGIALVSLVLYSGMTNMGDETVGILIGFTLGGVIFFLVAGLLPLYSSFATFNLKQKALWKNTVIAVIVLLGALFFLFIDFTVPASQYTGGEKPILNLPLHILAGVYALWNLYYLRRPAVRSLFVQ